MRFCVMISNEYIFTIGNASIINIDSFCLISAKVTPKPLNGFENIIVSSEKMQVANK